MKPWWQSKTLWGNALMGLGAMFGPGALFGHVLAVEELGAVMAVGNIALRLVTSKGLVK